jgi:hypothetical protein
VNSAGITLSLKNLSPLRTKHGKVVAVPAQHRRLVLYAGGDAALEEDDALGDDGEGQFNGGAAERNDVDSIAVQGQTDCVLEAGYGPRHVGAVLHQQTQIVVSEGTGVALHP